MAENIYLKCRAREKVFDSGGRVLNISVKAEELVAFATAHANNRGYLNLVISSRRETGQYGDTHSVKLDTFVPKTNADAPSSATGAEHDIPF